jgi:hypothetical protein
LQPIVQILPVGSGRFSIDWCGAIGHEQAFIGCPAYFIYKKICQRLGIGAREAQRL